MSERLKALVAAKARVAKLEVEVADELDRKLSRLPKEFGFESVAAFTKALRQVVSQTEGAKRRRAKITDTTRSRVRELVENGKTAREIANIVRISVASVHSIKRALGFVRVR